MSASISVDLTGVARVGATRRTRTCRPTSRNCRFEYAQAIDILSIWTKLTVAGVVALPLFGAVQPVTVEVTVPE